MRETVLARVKAFRRALEMARDRSDECCDLPRGCELKHFPRGSCDLASHFLAQYLRDSDPTLLPEIIFMEPTQSYRDGNKSTVKRHVIVALDEEYIDLTLDQFDEHNHPVLIEGKSGTLGTMLCEIEKSGGNIERREVNIYATKEDEEDKEKQLYNWLKHTADRLLNE
ncbi:hypothetical protein [Serratia liquefaciens]|uniref:hypothetical protein n=1 Tax=Serratia liquefaciens TaxID=614 RepID=UPI0039057730